MKDEAQLDLSIVRTQLPPQELGENPYWKFLNVHRMALVHKRPEQTLSIETSICKDHLDFCDKHIKLNLDKAANFDNLDFRIPPQVDNQLSECTPQFSLRNIPKVERYYDLHAKLPYNVEDMPIDVAQEAVHFAKTARIEPVEFVDFNASDILTDFQIFFEEILYLCPWEQVSRGQVDEDSLWHISQSKALLAKHLLDRRNSLFIYSYTGTHQIDAIPLAHGNVEQKKAGATPSSPFGETFGPPE